MLQRAIDLCLWAKFVVEVLNFVIMWACVFSSCHQMVIWGAPNYDGKNQRKMCHPNPCILCYLCMLIWPLDVSCDFWYLWVSSTLHENHPRDNWDFEIHNIIGATMGNQIKVLIDSICLLNKVITYIEDERV